jgi:proteic killer suppression protein
MIANFRHKGLRRLFEEDDPKGVNPEHVRKIGQILGLLNAAENIFDLDYATFRLHALKGSLRGYWFPDRTCELANNLPFRGR